MAGFAFGRGGNMGGGFSLGRAAVMASGAWCASQLVVE